MATRASGRAWPGVAVLAGLAVLAQLYGLYRVTGPPGAPWFPQADKLQHALGFALPVALCLLAAGLRARTGPARPLRLPRTALLVVTVAFGGHAVVSELVQHLFYSTRTGDPLDVLADAVGVLVGVLAASALLTRGSGRDRPAGHGLAEGGLTRSRAGRTSSAAR